MDMGGVPKIRNYQDLVVFQKARELAALTINVTKRFPDEEKYNLVAQMRAAAISISSNIAEGFRRFSPREYTRFLRIAHGSCAELESQTLIAHDVEWIPDQDYQKMIELQGSISRMLWSLIGSLEKRKTQIRKQLG